MYVIVNWLKADSFQQLTNYRLSDYRLPKLPYDYSALEPTIDTRTMALHHDKHHAGYVNNLNKALENYPDLRAKSAAELLFDLNAIPEEIRTAVRNNAGGHVNHVWEHAYYLKYENSRPDYVEARWSVVKWDFVEGNYVAYKVRAGVGQAIDKVKSTWKNLTDLW